ncbi:MAG: sulfurtransferase TusA family protein [Proteobacteria bacterium]|nr:sulfurtransferase TusA family protein [Pseudomonadota bacterium]
MTTHHELNARHLLCPMPVIKTQNLCKSLNSGDILTVFATDKGTKHDLPCWCRINGHKLISIQEDDNELAVTFEIIKD